MLRLHIANMNCGGCVKGVTRAVQSVESGATLDVDLAKHEVVVTGAKDGHRIVEALQRAGFNALPLESVQA